MNANRLLRYVFQGIYIYLVFYPYYFSNVFELRFRENCYLGELCIVYYDDFRENWPCYHRAMFYHYIIWYRQTSNIKAQNSKT